VNGDAVNGVETSGELTPSSDADSVTFDTASDHAKVFKQDIITITGRQENCEAARDAMLVCNDFFGCLFVALLLFIIIFYVWYALYIDSIYNK